MKQAQLYKSSAGQKLKCYLCRHACVIPEGKFGFCRIRQNIKGVLYTHNYGKLVALNTDPVEKKPLYHFLPGTKTFSLACAGCNFRCGFCQNWEISQVDFKQSAPGEDFSIPNIIKAARHRDCRSIAYTYTEPTIFYEFALDVMRPAKESGLRNIFVTNGYMTKEAALSLKPYLDAANIDLKFFAESSYRKICSAGLKPVLESIDLFHSLGIWIEITTLIIPGENDSPSQLTGIARFIAGIDKNIPWHISRFHADYEFSEYSSTPETTLKLAYEIAKKEGLRYIYAGNISGWGQDTFCSKCNNLLIKREGFSISEQHLLENKCSFCQAVLPGVYDA